MDLASIDNLWLNTKYFINEGNEEVKRNIERLYHGRKRVSEIIEIWKELFSEEVSIFKYGFRLGVGIMVEVLTGEEVLASELSIFPDKTQ